MTRFILGILAICAFLSAVHAQEKHVPSFEEVISLRGVSGPKISSDGRHVLFSLNTTDWEINRYDSEIWISKDGGEPFPLTNTPDGRSFDAKWSPSGAWIAFKATRGDHTQIHAIRLAGGEAQPVTQVTGSIGQYDWAPDGSQIAFILTPEDDKEDKERKDQFGAYSVDDEEYELAELFVVDFKPDARQPHELPCHEETDSLKKINCIRLPEPEALIDSVDFTVNSFIWSPDGTRMLINKRPDPLINSFFKADIAQLDIESKELTDLVTNPSFDAAVRWSPDGNHVLYQSAVDNLESLYYANNRLFIMPVEGGEARELGADFDEDISVVDWNPGGIYFTAWQKTDRALYRLDPANGSIRTALSKPNRVFGVTFSKDGSMAAVQGRDDGSLNEIYRFDIASQALAQVTRSSQAIADWKVSHSEVIRWTSHDGAEIEGVLHKPADYDPTRAYPLMVIIHGGPTGISTPSAVTGYVYPVLQWLDKGALVLQPNYRGSAGYGSAFRKLNVRNLGVGDAWDVLSGVDYLAEQGMIDTTRMGCMGWSQGGYISAFLTTTSNRFKAISVGAGISNWMTYYVNTDIHPFTRQYLKANPWEDAEIYAKTSPMTYINQATTPTLIQHGEFDRRVPIPNAYELLQGLRDVGVASKLIVYKGFGHGINKPKERLAATWHNWQWFNKYVWEEETQLPFELNNESENK